MSEACLFLWIMEEMVGHSKMDIYGFLSSIKSRLNLEGF